MAGYDSEIRILLAFSWNLQEMVTHFLQYSCMKNPMDRGAWWTIVHGDAEFCRGRVSPARWLSEDSGQKELNPGTEYVSSYIGRI